MPFLKEQNGNNRLSEKAIELRDENTRIVSELSAAFEEKVRLNQALEEKVREKERQIDKHEKTELEQQIRKLREKKETLIDQALELQERHRRNFPALFVTQWFVEVDVARPKPKCDKI